MTPKNHLSDLQSSHSWLKLTMWVFFLYCSSLFFLGIAGLACVPSKVWSAGTRGTLSPVDLGLSDFNHADLRKNILLWCQQFVNTYCRHLDQSWSCPPKLCNHFAEPSGTWGEKYHATVTCTVCRWSHKSTKRSLGLCDRSGCTSRKSQLKVWSLGTRCRDIAPRHSCPRFKSSAASSFFSTRS